MAGIKVVLDIYSGRPNPDWELSDREVEDLRRRLQESRREPVRERPEPPGLGFRGFLIRNPRQEAGLPYEIEVFGGFLSITETPEDARQEGRRPPELFADTGRIHDWLLDQARRRDFSDSIAAMGGPRQR